MSQERTEKPTQKRLNDAREKGQVARSRDLALAAAESDAPADAINFLRSLPDRIYTSPNDVLRQFGEAGARFGLFSTDVRHRGDIGKEAVETGAAPTKHP